MSSTEKKEVNIVYYCSGWGKHNSSLTNEERTGFGRGRTLRGNSMREGGGKGGSLGGPLWGRCGDLAGQRVVAQIVWCMHCQRLVYLHLKPEMKKISKHSSATIIMRTRSISPCRDSRYHYVIASPPPRSRSITPITHWHVTGFLWSKLSCAKF